MNENTIVKLIKNLPLTVTGTRSFVSLATSSVAINAPLYTKHYSSGEKDGVVEGQTIGVGLSSAGGNLCTAWKLVCEGY